MNWHRLFGLMLIDFFTGSPFEVELEKDLSLKQQFLDVIVLRKRGGQFSEPLPDGLDNLSDYNLITFKSHHESLDDWSLKELTGHYVNFRKQISPSMQELLPETSFRLYAVCARFPQHLAWQTDLAELQPGVHQLQRGTDVIRVIVTGQLPETDNNAVLHLFSAAPERIRFGAEHYRLRAEDGSTVINRLFEAYQVEGLKMPYTMEDFRRDYVKEHLKDLTPEERLEGLPPEEVVKQLPPEERLKGLPPEERLKGLPPEEILKRFSVEEIERYLNEFKKHEGGQ